jgi:hypothetical protein
VDLEAGLIGLVVGAVASGSVQTYLSRADRRRSGRDATRVLYMELHEAEAAIHELRPRRDWGLMVTDWESFGAVWSKYRDRATNVLRTPEFVAVDSAFACMATLARAWKNDLAKMPPGPGHAPHFDPADKILALYYEVVKGAKRIVLKASFRWWEVRARRKALSA